MGGTFTACAAVGTNSRSVGRMFLGATTLQPSRLRTRRPAADGVDRNHRPAQFEDTEQHWNIMNLAGVAADGHPSEPQPLVGPALPPRSGHRLDIVLLFYQPPSPSITSTIPKRIGGNRFGFAYSSGFQ